jgi:hypothetical protein
VRVYLHVRTGVQIFRGAQNPDSIFHKDGNE